jgi:hypothetical protein
VTHELKIVDNTKPIERCDECGKILNREPYVFYLPDGKKICAECLYVKHGREMDE